MVHHDPHTHQHDALPTEPAPQHSGHGEHLTGEHHHGVAVPGVSAPGLATDTAPGVLVPVPG